MIPLGLDIGHDGVKAVCGKKKEYFPSCAIDRDEAPAMLGDDADTGTVVDVDGREFVVGLPRDMTSRHTRTYGMDFIRSPHWKALALHAISQFTTDKLLVCVGLPSEMARDTELKDEVKARLAKTHKVAGRSISVEQVMVVSQPFGAVRSWQETKEGRAYAASTVAVVDVGAGTSDLEVTQHGQVYRNAGSSIDVAAHTVLKDVADAAAKLADVKTINHGRVEQALRDGKIMTFAGGRTVDLSEPFDRAAESAAEKIAGWALSATRDYPVEAALLAGGGAILLDAHLKDRIDHLMKHPNPLYANAGGFALLAADKLSKAEEVNG